MLRIASKNLPVISDHLQYLPQSESETSEWCNAELSIGHHLRCVYIQDLSQWFFSIFPWHVISHFFRGIRFKILQAELLWLYHLFIFLQITKSMQITKCREIQWIYIECNLKHFLGLLTGKQMLISCYYPSMDKQMLIK